MISDETKLYVQEELKRERAWAQSSFAIKLIEYGFIAVMALLSFSVLKTLIVGAKLSV